MYHWFVDNLPAELIYITNIEIDFHPLLLNGFSVLKTEKKRLPHENEAACLLI